MSRLFGVLIFLLAAFSGGFWQTAYGQITIDITEGNIDPTPTAVPNFIGNDEPMVALGRDITGVLKADLDRSGLFAVIDPRAYIENLEGVNRRPRFVDWRQINAQILVVGQIDELPDGRIQVSTRIWDSFTNQQLGAVAFKTPADNWRRAAHKVADFIYKTMTGEEGYFDTRIVFVHETGPKENRVKRLMIMDQDGDNPLELTDGTRYKVLTPRFSPTQQQITYMALYDNRPGQVFLFNIETGEQEQLGTFRGMTFAPRFSPNGTKVIMSVERGGNSDVFTMDLSTRRLERLTQHPAIDTSPSYSPDGQQITFASDRGGSSQLYVMGADGSNPRRITFKNGIYHTPVWSPRGDLIAFTRQYQGQFFIGVIRPDGTGERELARSFLVEGPTWSPNGRVLMFFRETAPRADGTGGQPALWSVDLTGRNLRQVRTPGAASDPAWSPSLP